MGAWEDQAKQTAQRKKSWSNSQQFDFISALLEAVNEEEVKAAYIKEFSLPVRMQERHDLMVRNVLFEFKYSAKLVDIEITSRIAAQAIYYINRLFRKGRISEIEYLVIADKDEARIFKIAEFKMFYESQEYQWDGYRPSSPDPKLIEDIKNSKILESNRVYNFNSGDGLNLFSSRLYQILWPNKTAKEPVGNSNKGFSSSRLKFLAIGIGVALLLLTGTIAGSQYYLKELKQASPAGQQQ